MASSLKKASRHRKATKKDVLDALVRLEAEFRLVFPIYYYSEPWAHDRNEALRFAQAIIKAAK